MKEKVLSFFDQQKLLLWKNLILRFSYKHTHTSPHTDLDVIFSEIRNDLFLVLIENLVKDGPSLTVLFQQEQTAVPVIRRGRGTAILWHRGLRWNAGTHADTVTPEENPCSNIYHSAFMYRWKSLLDTTRLQGSVREVESTCWYVHRLLHARVFLHAQQWVLTAEDHKVIKAHYISRVKGSGGQKATCWLMQTLHRCSWNCMWGILTWTHLR